MDIFDKFTQGVRWQTLRTVEMHTVGEPTRIIVDGYPELEGKTLLEKREYARVHYDRIRKLLMHEPRGHFDMYGAILVPKTELTERGEADIGVLFCHNDGYSTMCGHATIALGRFLVDTEDLNLFPLRTRLPYDAEKQMVILRLHAPCGVVRVSVPVIDRPTSFVSSSAPKSAPSTSADQTAPSSKSMQKVSDPRRRVAFLSVPATVVKQSFSLVVPPSHSWPELLGLEGKRVGPPDAGNYSIKLDIAFGGAFYAIVEAIDLGFHCDDKGRVHYDRKTIKAAEFAAQQIKSLLEPIMSGLLVPFKNTIEKDLHFLYGVTIVDGNKYRSKGGASAQTDRNLCFFANSQLDRSPTGSCVAARTALAAFKGVLKAGEHWECYSIVSPSGDGEFEELAAVERECFTGKIHQEFLDSSSTESSVSWYTVQVEGLSWYTGSSTFSLENGDMIGQGFLVGE